MPRGDVEIFRSIALETSARSTFANTRFVTFGPTGTVGGIGTHGSRRSVFVLGQFADRGNGNQQFNQVETPAVFKK